jgi:hypothetical protein
MSLRSKRSAVRIGPGVPSKSFGFFRLVFHFGSLPLKIRHYRTKTVSKLDLLSTAVSKLFC